MATFSKCLAIINKMSQQDQDALLARLDELQAQGLTAKEAQMQAAVDTLAQVQQEASIKKSPERPDLVAAADAIAAMDPEVRDNTEIGDFPGAASGYNLYEARQLVKKPSDKLKRVTESNTFSLWQNYDYVANVDGDHFGVTKEEDPDEVDDETKFVYSFENLKSPFDSGKTTSTDQTDELFKEMRESLGKDIRKSVERPEFYSQLQRAIDQVPQRLSTMAAPAWKQWLTANAPKLGIKAEEIEWSGIKDWLDLEGHPKPVYESGFGLVEEMKNGSGEWEQTDDLGHYFRTKAEAEAAITDEMKASAEQFGKKYATEGRISVKHFDGDALNFGKTTTPKITKEDISRYLDDSGVKISETVLGKEAGEWRVFNGQNTEYFSTRQEAISRANQLGLEIGESVMQVEGDSASTKYGKYSLPGGENYREVLLTLPGKSVAGLKGVIKFDSEMSVDDFLTDLSAEGLESLDYGATEDSSGRTVVEFDGLTQSEKAKFESLLEQYGHTLSYENGAKDAPLYRSSHWDQPNVLAHIRVNDRTDADGKRVLFVEEVQSDWGQEGKKKGFATKSVRKVDGGWALFDGNEQVGPAMESKASAEEDLRDSQGGYIPTAPFVTKTEGWLNLALKRIAMLAVEGGYDKVAFVNGEQSADRYDLSKSIDRIDYSRNGDGTYDISAVENGKEVFVRGALPESEIEDVVGKEVAQKIINGDGVAAEELDPVDRWEPDDSPINNTSFDFEKTRTKSLAGVDLKVGGEGMKTFYDQIVPQAINKLLPKLGGEKLGVAQINVGDKEAIAKWKRMTANSTIESTPIKEYETQPGFDVTDKMRETVGQGTPLFSRERLEEDVDNQYDGDIKFSTVREYEPKNTVTAYKLFRVDQRQPGKLFPLFVNANKPVPMGEWLKAEVGPMTGDKVKSKLGPLAFRPGWHAGDVPVATHIGMKDGVADKAPKYRNPDHVWAEVEFGDDVDWQAKANERGTNASGKLVPVKAHITDQIPEGGHYRYKTNPNMTGTWLIGGEMKVVRILSDDEVNAINDEAGVADLPRKAPFDSAKYGFNNIRKSPDRPWFDDLSQLKVSKTYQLGDLLKTSKKLSWWNRTIGTQYDLAQKHPQFKRVFDAVQHFINGVSYYATRAADLAPTILPKLESWKDIAKSPLSAADVKALRDPIFGGTLKYTRDEDGNIVETDDVSTAGVVFKDEELRSMFGLNDRQIGLYREFRQATNKSLSDLAVSDMLRYLGKDGEGVRQRALEAGSLTEATNAMVAHLDMLIGQQPERAEVLENTKKAIKEKSGQAIGLMARGYAPLSRFGQYTVYAVGKDGEQLYFSMFENERDANKMAREMEEQYPDATVTTGTMSQESYKLFSGVTPETLELFGEQLGFEESGVDPKSEAFQAYLKMAKTNRSAMKRLIERKGIQGFSEDAGRVLAGFVYSNARQISTNLHAGEISRGVQAIDQRDGDIKDAAVKLMEYVQNPREEAQALRGLMFTNFIGGSIASAMVNMTQPFTMTMPYLSQFDGITGAAKRMSDAVKLVTRGIRNDDDLAKALKYAEDEGIVSPQEVHQLMAQAQGRGALQSGDGTKAGDAAAKVNNTMAKLGLAWGKVFSAAEQFNRRVTFIAAYKLAREKGMENPMAFAEQAIVETQGLYNKGNKPTWARGAVGSTLFTFKQYSIGYIEFLRRMWGNGPEGKKAVGLALAVLFMSAGLGGMPGADDLDDIIDGFMQRVLGKSFDTKQAKKEFFASILGQSGAEFVMSGLSGLPGMPIDIAGRTGLGNLVPGTGMLTKKQSYGQDIAEIFGPAGAMAKQAATAAANVTEGNFAQAASSLAPVAAQNWVKALDMATTGMYRDQKGRKVIDVNGWEAMAKAIGFQPASVKNVQEATSTQQNLIGQNRIREQEIADLWTQGRIEKDEDKIAKAKQQLKDWNETNPESPIRIDPTQINRRVKEANMDKAKRIEKTAPKEIRASVKRELEKDLAQ